MTEEDLKRLEALAEAATEGPWTFEECEDWPGRVEGITSHLGRIVETDAGCYPPELRDAAFICAARTAVPEMAQELRWAWESADKANDENARMRARLCEIGDHVWHEALPHGTDDLKAFLMSGAKVPHRCRFCGVVKPT